MNLNRFITTPLLLGYVILVPFCFFWAPVMPHVSGMDMPGNSARPMNDCGMSTALCAVPRETDAVGLIAHHMSMYLSISQTPPEAAITTVAAFSSVVIVFFILHDIRALFMQYSSRFSGRIPNKLRNPQKRYLLAWLSLFETSPNFA